MNQETNAEPPVASALPPGSVSQTERGEDLVNRRTLLGVAGLLGAVALGKHAAAGPLTPPAGPITPTAKPLGQIEPRTPLVPSGSNRLTISAPGSYYLTGNCPGGVVLTPTSGNLLHPVSIDLAGFTVGSTSLTVAAIDARTCRQVHIHSGTVQVGASDGVQFAGGLIENLNIYPNGNTSANVGTGVKYELVSAEPGTPGILRNVRCLAPLSGSGRLLWGARGNFSEIDHCTFQQIANGIECSTPALISNCLILLNGSEVDGLASFGIKAFFTSIVRNCVIQSAYFGLEIGQASIIDSCIFNNNLVGLYVARDSLVTNCVFDLAEIRAVFATGPCVRILDNCFSRTLNCIDLDSHYGCVVGRNHFADFFFGSLIVNGTSSLVGPLFGPSDFATMTHPLSNTYGA